MAKKKGVPAGTVARDAEVCAQSVSACRARLASGLRAHTPAARVTPTYPGRACVLQDTPGIMNQLEFCKH